MVYLKSDGSYGFSWQQQYDFLVREHPDQLEEIVQSKLELLVRTEPDKSETYKALDAELRERINAGWDSNPHFGYEDSDKIVKAFVLEKNLCELFDDVPALLHVEEPVEEFTDEWLSDLEGIDWIV